MSKQRKRVSDLVTELNAACDRMTDERRMFVSAHALRRIPADVMQLIEELTPIPAGATATLSELIHNTRSALIAGFVLAIARYNRELKSNAEAMRIITARAVGGSKGRMAQASRKQERRSRVQAMLDQGMEVPDIAKQLHCSASTVYRLSQPDRSTSAKPTKKPRRR